MNRPETNAGNIWLLQYIIYVSCLKGYGCSSKHNLLNWNYHYQCNKQKWNVNESWLKICSSHENNCFF